MEFNQAALDWMDSVAANLQRGYVITIDYGHSANEFQEMFRFAPAIEISIRPLSKSVMRTSQCTWIGQACPARAGKRLTRRRFH